MIEIYYSSAPKIFSRPKARQLAEAALRAVNFKADATVGVSFLSPGKIRTLNREQRGEDKVTDVLSFPLGGAAPQGFPANLGDIVICLDEARHRAPAENLNESEELLMLFTHGLLHLLGRHHDGGDTSALALLSRILKTVGVKWDYRQLNSRGTKA